MTNLGATKISVIIPVYRAEPYLRKCLKSVCGQTYSNLEIICIHDCSPDRSIDILREFAERDARIKIIDRPQNGGYSIARNDGIDAATGDYIYFIDSDDYIASDYLEHILQKSEDADVIINTNILKVSGDTCTPLIWKFLPKDSIGEGKFLSAGEAVNTTPVYLWSHLFKKSLFDKYHLRLPEGYIHEDEYFQHISKIRANKVFVFHGPAYYYVQHEGSFMATRKNFLIPYMKIVNLLIDFYNANSSLLKQHKIRIALIGVLLNLKDEQDYLAAKPVIDKLVASQLRFDYADIEHFIIHAIASSSSYEDLRLRYGRNLQVAYLRHSMLQRKTAQ